MPVLPLPDSATVSTTRIRHRYRRVDGTPVPFAKVVARLVAPHGWLLDKSEVAELAEAVSESDGSYEFNLIPTGLYEYGAAYYEISEGSTIWPIAVPPPPLDGSPVQLRDCLINRPESAPSTVIVSPTLYVIGPADTTDGIPPGVVVYQLAEPL